MEPLRQYQVDAIKFIKEHTRSYLALDMGLGKTRIALEHIKNTLPETKAYLVIAPLRTIYTTWPDEIKKWTPDLTYAILHGPEKQREFNKDVNVYLVNFEGIKWLHGILQKHYNKFKRVPFKGLIIDEGSMVKSWKTQRFKALKTYRAMFPKYRTILSGTPAPKSLLDLWSQYYLLDDGKRLGTGITKYKEAYFLQDPYVEWNWEIRDGKADIIHNLIADITYRLDAEDYLNIPERIDNIIPVQLPVKLMNQYKQLEKDFFIGLETAEVEAFSSAALSMKLRQFIQGGMYINKEGDYEIIHNEKLKILESLVEEAGGQGILCAVQFRFELDMIQSKFPNTPIIAKGVKVKDATRYINEWNEGKIPLLLCHPASLAHGVNMQTGSHIILWYGLPWSLEHYLQLNKRLHRSGQRNNVIVHHLVGKDTIDERVLAALHAKCSTQQQLLNFIKGYHNGNVSR